MIASATREHQHVVDVRQWVLVQAVHQPIPGPVPLRVVVFDRRPEVLRHEGELRGVGVLLPLLTREIYGTEAYYLRVAQVNNLDDFRNLTPGQVLFFPPLDSKTAGEL